METGLGSIPSTSIQEDFMRSKRLLPSLVALALIAPASLAQSNLIPGLDVELGFLDGLDDEGRTGTFPNGRNGFAMSTTSCNPGTVEAVWEAAMDPDHPFICFIMTRESDGRMVQISDHSRVKHGFFALSSNQCGYGCSGTDGSELGLGCSDTYGIGTNAGRNNLGPAEEINPWLGTWNPICSLFDGPNCDGQRSYFGSEPNGVNGRVEVDDAELNVPGANFYYYSIYIVQGEAEANRDNNMGWRQAGITWNGSGYNVSPMGSNSANHETVLNAWSGATINSNTNGADDGRVYIASDATPAGGGLTHYEYAVHNRDNNRAVESLRIPVAPGTVVSNYGFHDIDDDAANDWTLQVVGNEIVLTQQGSNPILWNSIFNFWFDANASAQIGTATVTQFFGGAGASSFTIQTEVPGGGVIDPCAQADDGFEENDSCVVAANVSSGFSGGLFVEKTDEDWYQATLADGETFTLTTNFSHANGNIDIQLFDSCGGAAIQSSLSTSDNESVSVTNSTGGSVTYRARVFVPPSSAQDCNNYGLDVVITGAPMGGCTDPDGLEDNDSCAGALALGVGTVNGLTVQKTDEDWYAVTLTPNQTLTFTMTFLDVNGDLDLELYDACGAGFITQSNSASDNEQVMVTNTTGSNQTYFARCFVWPGAPEDCNDYGLTVDIQGGQPMTGCPNDDVNEPDDSCAGATPVSAGLLAGLTSQAGDDDWSSFTLTPGQTADVTIFFSDASGDIDLQVFQACGGSSLQTSQSVTDNESVSVTNNSGGNLTYRTRVYLFGGSSCNEYDYQLTISGGDPCSVPDDGLEENDTCAAAVPQTSGTQNGLFVSKTDSDWYSVAVPNGATLDVDILFSHAMADVDLFLFDACGGTQLDDGFSADDNESVTWTNNSGSAVDVKVEVNVWPNSSGDCNTYDMIVDVQGGGPTNLVPFCFGDGSGTPCPCGNNSPSGHPGGCMNSAGLGAVLVASGDPSVANDTLSFTCTNATPFALGVLVSANNQLGGGNGILGMPPQDGIRCVGGGLLRHGGRSIQFDGTPFQPWGFGAPSPPGGILANAGFVAGQVRHFQLLVREFDTKVCMTGQNTSQAISVTIGN